MWPRAPCRGPLPGLVAGEPSPARTSPSNQSAPYPNGGTRMPGGAGAGFGVWPQRRAGAHLSGAGPRAAEPAAAAAAAGGCPASRAAPPVPGATGAAPATAAASAPAAARRAAGQGAAAVPKSGRSAERASAWAWGRNSQGHWAPGWASGDPEPRAAQEAQLQLLVACRGAPRRAALRRAGRASAAPPACLARPPRASITARPTPAPGGVALPFLNRQREHHDTHSHQR